MSEIVAAVTAVHAPYITGIPDEADPDVRERTYEGFRQLGEYVHDSGADTVIAFTSEHVVNLRPECVPPFLMGVGTRYDIYPEPMFNLPTDPIAGDREFALSIANRLYDSGFELAHSVDLKLDHGTNLPLHLMKLRDLSLVTVLVNTLWAPMARLRRTYELGKAIGDAIASDGLDRRVALLATGCISHTVGDVEMGSSDEEFDRMFLQKVADRDYDSLAALSEAQVTAAGNGTEEVRNWLLLLGAVPREWRPEILVNEPHPRGWELGIYLIK